MKEFKSKPIGNLDESEWGKFTLKYEIALENLKARENLTDEQYKLWHQRRAESMKDRVFSEEHRIKLSESASNRTWSEEERKMLSESHKGHKWSEQTRKHFKKIFKGEGNPNYGNTWNDEQRKRQSEITQKLLSVTHKCEHCGKEVRGLGNFTRWHGDNCKHKK
jgi:ribosomal protein L37AE/L43A